MSKWVTVWGNAMSITEQNQGGYAKDITLSYPILMPLDADEITLTFDNFTGFEKVVIENVTISYVVNQDFIDESSIQDVKFDGLNECILEPGCEKTSDSIPFDISKGDVLMVRMYLKECTSLRCGVQMFGKLGKGSYSLGDDTYALKLPSDSSKAIDWCYYLSKVNVKTNDDARSIICFGDSITCLGWPDYLQLSLMKEDKNVSVVRKAVSGSRVLRQYDCITYANYGIKGLTRFPHETDAEGADTVIILHGINDLIHPVGVEVNEFRPWSDLPTVEDIIEGYKEYIKVAREKNLKIYMGTLTPISGWRTYEPFRNDLRNQINEWIKSTDLIDGFIDFDAVLKDDEDPTKMKDICDSGDHLHPGDQGLMEMAKEALKYI